MATLQEIKVPLLAVNDTVLTVVEKNFQQGTAVKTGDCVLVFETSKTTYEVIVEKDGWILYHCDVDKEYEVNTLVAEILDQVPELKQQEFEKTHSSTITSQTPTAALQTIAWTGKTLFSYEAAKIIEANNLSIERFEGKTLVGKKDVFALLGKVVPQIKRSESKIQEVLNTKLSLEPTIDEELVKLLKVNSQKKKEIEYLSSVQNAGLISTINIRIDAKDLYTLMLKSLNILKGNLLPVIVYEVSRLLTRFPLLNAYYTSNGIAIYNQVNVGFAIDIDKGLKVINLREANLSSLHELENRILDSSDRYSNDELIVSDLVDVGFTITDLSSEGVCFFTPLVNYKNSAILGISSIDKKDGGLILSLTFDHRVTEGKYVAQFLSALKQRLESYKISSEQKLAQIYCHKCFKTLSEDIAQVGFVKCIDSSGHDAYICQSCFKGY